MDTDNERGSSRPAKTPRGKDRKTAKVAAGKSRSRGKSGNKPTVARNKAAAADKTGRSGKSTGKKTAQPARKKSTGKTVATKPKKAATRRKTVGKPASRGRKATGKSGAAGDLLVPDPPPVELPPVPEAAADDPRSLSWMATQAVSALNAVKANQAEKGKLIMARAEKDNSPGDQQASPLEAMPSETMSPLPRQDAAETVPGTEPGDGAAPPEAAEAAEEVVTDAAARVDTQDGVARAETVAGTPVAQSAATRPAPVAPPTTVRRTLFSPHRLVAAVAILGVVAIGVWYGGGEDVRDLLGIEDRMPVVETQPVDPDVTGSPADTSVADDKAQEADTVAADAGSGWTPAILRFPQPESQKTAAEADAKSQSGSGNAAPADSEAVPSAAATDTAPAPAVAGADRVSAETAPATPQTPAPVPAAAPAPAAPRYGYYPPQMGWRQPPYYRPAYARPPAY